MAGNVVTVARGLKPLATVCFNAGLKAGSSTVVLAVVKARKNPLFCELLGIVKCAVKVGSCVACDC
jgi:hypothetical protein